MNKLLYIVSILSLCVAVSCKKSSADNILGLDVQPKSDLLGVTISDTSSVYMHTIETDSVLSFNGEFKFIGSNQDPVFGRSDLSIYSNISLPNNVTSLDFGIDPQVDHAEIRMRYNSAFLGDTTTPLRYDVYTLQGSLSADSISHYFTSSTVARNQVPIGSILTKPKYVTDGTDTGVYVVIPIDKNFAEYMIRNPSYLVDNATYLTFYKGVYITTAASTLNPASQQGAIIQVDLDANLSGLFVYYRNGNSPYAKPKEFQFTFRGVDNVRFNHVHVDHHAGGAANLVAQLNGDTMKGQQNIYLQGFGGTKVKLQIPYLKNYSSQQHVAINRAELALYFDDANSSNSNYVAPPSLALMASDAYGHETYLKDQYTTSVQLFGGYYDATNKKYVFNIARQVQDIVDGKVANNGFYLIQADPSPGLVTVRDSRLERAVIGGPNNIVFKPAFRVTYIKYPYDK